MRFLPHKKPPHLFTLSRATVPLEIWLCIYRNVLQPFVPGRCSLCFGMMKPLGRSWFQCLVVEKWWPPWWWWWWWWWNCFLESLQKNTMEIQLSENYTKQNQQPGLSWNFQWNFPYLMSNLLVWLVIRHRFLLQSIAARKKSPRTMGMHFHPSKWSEKSVWNTSVTRASSNIYSSELWCWGAIVV